MIVLLWAQVFLFVYSCTLKNNYMVVVCFCSFLSVLVCYLIFVVCFQMDKNYTLEVHHGGFFVEQPKKPYVQEKLSYVDNIDLDKMSLFELQVLGMFSHYVASSCVVIYVVNVEVVEDECNVQPPLSDARTVCNIDDSLYDGTTSEGSTEEESEDDFLVEEHVDLEKEMQPKSAKGKTIAEEELDYHNKEEVSRDELISLKGSDDS